MRSLILSLASTLAKSRSDRRIVGRVAPENDERLDQPGVHVANQLAERADLVGGPGIHPGNELDRLADVAESLVDQMSQRVNLGRLRFAGDDQTLAAMGRQVACQRVDPAGVAGEPVREFVLVGRTGVPDSQLAGDGLGESRQRLATARPAGDRPRPR